MILTALGGITLAMEILQTLHADGCGQDDHCGIAKYYEKLTGTEIRK